MREIPLGDLRVYPVYRTLGQVGEMNALVVSRDGKSAFIGGSDGSVVVSTLFKPGDKNNQGRAGETLSVRKLLQSSRPILGLALSPDEKLLAIAQFSSVVVIDAVSGEKKNELTQVEGRLLSIAWDPRGEIILLGRTSGEVFGWRLSGFPNAGLNSKKSVESYGTAGGVPILRLAFHPSGRMFISADRDGKLSLWRLLRTERELGMRDESSEMDKDLKGSKEIDIGKSNAPLEDMWLDGTAQEVMISGADGKIDRWKLRGIEKQDELDVGPDAVGSIQGVDVSRTDGRTVRFLVATGRGQNVKIFCRTTPGDTTLESNSNVTIEMSPPTTNAVDVSQETRIVDGRLIVAEAKPKPVEQKPVLGSVTGQLVSQSVTMKEAVGLLRSGGSMLWGTQKKGNLLVFDARPALSQLLDQCPVS